MTTTNMRRLAAALVLGVVLAACGGGGGDEDDGVASLDENAAADESDEQGDDEPSGPGGGRVDESEMQDAALEFAQCMRDNGIDMPDPQFEEGGGISLGIESEGGRLDPESEEFKAAEEECQPILDEARPDMQLSAEEQAEMQDRLVAMAECMRARGHDMPDPQVSEDGGVRITRGSPDDAGGGAGPPDEEFEHDMEECSEEAGMGEGPGFTSRSEEDE